MGTCRHPRRIGSCEIQAAAIAIAIAVAVGGEKRYRKYICLKANGFDREKTLFYLFLAFAAINLFLLVSTPTSHSLNDVDTGHSLSSFLGSVVASFLPPILSSKHLVSSLTASSSSIPCPPFLRCPTTLASTSASRASPRVRPLLRARSETVRWGG